MTKTISDLTWTFRNVKVAPDINGYKNVLISFDYIVYLIEGEFKVWRFGSTTLCTAYICPDKFVELSQISEDKLKEIAIEEYGTEKFNLLLASLEEDLEKEKAKGSFTPPPNLPFDVFVATSADIAVSQSIPPDWRVDGNYAVDALVMHNGRIWRHISDNQGEPDGVYDLKAYTGDWIPEDEINAIAEDY